MCVRVQFTRGTVQSQHLYFDRDNFFLLQCIKNTPYYAIFTPSFKSLVNAIPFAVFFWKCPPFAPVFGNIQDSVDKCAIVDFYIPTLNRKILFDSCILFFCDIHVFIISYFEFSVNRLYITGPTGSGKTTTLYMVLQRLAERPVNISTIEDPVEKDLPNITQTSVNVTAGMTFAVGLRALLRQDPDIIMIGETRDAETAEISVRSAITGHLVVSTLHTNDAISSIVRLADMGVAPYLISNSVVGIVAQRLVRKVCQFCKYEEPATAEDIAIVGDGIPMITRGKGCKVCNNTGYKGRISIHEMVYIDKTLKRMIARSADSQEMLEYAKKTQGMRSLMDSAIDLVKEGVTTPEEVMKIAYYSD